MMPNPGHATGSTAMRLAVLVKQVPAVGEMSMGPDGRLIRDAVELEMNAYCRRAVSKAVELASERPGSSVTVITLGPPSAEDSLREAIAWGTDRNVATDGVLVSDAACAGSDTLATARAVAAALRLEGPFDLTLCGKNSIDADTGQVPPQVAEMLDLPFATAVKALELEGDVLTLGCELDDQWLDCEITLPAVLSCAERLCDPAKVPPPGRELVPSDRIRHLDAAALGEGPWGEDGSATWVGSTKILAVDRLSHVEPDAPLPDQVRTAVDIIKRRGGLDQTPASPITAVLPSPGGQGAMVAVIGESGRVELLRELLAEAARLATEINGSTALLTADHEIDADALASYGADHIVHLQGAEVEEDLADAVATWAGDHTPWGILTGSTAGGREVAARVAARLEAGLTGDAVELDVEDGRLVAWKPAFGGQLVAAIHTSSPVQMATVRSGVLPVPEPRPPGPMPASIERRVISPRGRVVVHSRTRDDDIDILADAEVVIGVGQGVDHEEYGSLEPLVELLGAEIGCTRKVTDQGWMPHARQIGITGRTIAPRLFVMIGASGKFNHTVGIRAATSVLAINNDADVPAWDHADAGIVGDWRDVLPLLVTELAKQSG